MKNINELLFKENKTADFIKNFTGFIKKRCKDAGDSYDLSSSSNLTFSLDEFENMPDDLKERFTSIQTIGCLKLDKQYVAMFLVRSNKDLNERSCRRKQFDFAKKILLNTPGKINNWFHSKCINFASGLFLFLSQDCQSYRLSLVECKKDQNQFKRYTFFVSADQRNRTFCDRIGSGKKWETFADLKEVFSVEKLSDDFFNAYKEYYQKFIDSAVIVDDDSKKIFADTGDKDKALRDYVKKMMGRLVFLQFLQKKGWLGVQEGAEWGNGDKEYLKKLFENSSDKDNFLEAVLEKLFFNTLNQNRGDDAIADAVLAVNGGKVRIPYLNGGLFEKDKLDAATVKFPADCFRDLFDTFERYNFTIDENEPNEKEVGVDPEMLGRIFENLLEDNKDKGAFYTPKEIVQYMCEESLIAYLGDTEANRKLVKEFDESGIKNKAELIEKLKDVKICDPAIGSGAFPMGMLNILYRIRMKLEKLDDTAENIVRIKKEIIQNNIYGVDIEAGAVDIARLRFWLSIVVDETEPIPLPNLDYKIMQGNSLLESFNGVDLSTITLEMTKKSSRKSKGALHPDMFAIMTDDDLTPQAMQELIRYYYDIHDPVQKAEIRKRLNWRIARIMKESFFHHPEDVAKVDAIDWNNKNFFLWRTYFMDVFEKGGFDIVIGNPPYIGEKYHKTLFEPVKKSKKMRKYYLGKMDYFYFFFHLALDMLKDNAIGIFITTNYFPTATGAKTLRSDLKSRAVVLALCNFGELRLFDNAAGQHNMITLFQKSSSKNKFCNLIDIHRKGVFAQDIITGIEEKNLSDCVFRNVTQTELFEGEDNYIRFSSATSNSIIGEIIFDKMTYHSYKLGDITSVRTGIMGGCDNLNKKNIEYISEQLVSSNFKVNDGVFVLDTHNKRDEARIKELKKHAFLKAFYKNSDISKYTVSNIPEKYIVFSAPGNLEQEQLLIKQHLAPYRSVLEHIRKINNEKVDYWYLLRRGTSHKEIFECPKIVAPQRSKYNVFGYHEGEWYASADVYYITHASNGYSLKFILGLLNSRLYYYWLYHKGKRKGETLELYQAPVSKIPIPIVDQVTQNLVVSLIDKILDLKLCEQDVDTSYYEQQIDDIVYKLFGLTDEEIAVIEESLKKPATEGKKQKGKTSTAVPATSESNDGNEDGDW